MMEPELFWLCLTLLLTAAMSLPYIVDRQLVRGPWRALANDVPETGSDQSVWAQRAMSAHRNAVENLVLFAPAVMAILWAQVSTDITRISAETYFFARLVHYVAYTSGVPVIRTLAFMAGLVATILIVLSALHWI